MSNYSNYNGYYSKRRSRPKLNISYSPIYPTTKYRDKKPELKDFGLEKIDLNELEQLYNNFKKEKEKIESQLLLLFFGSFIFVPSTSLIDKNLSIYALIGCIILGIALNSKKNNMKFEFQKEYDNYSKYKDACNNYKFWQDRKVESFWFGLSGRGFETEVCKIFNSMGYKAYLCKQGGDGGVDIDLYDKNGEHCIVQCKAHKAKISPGVARDLYGTMTALKVNRGYLVTLLGGTEGTIDFCRKNGISLLDINDLIKYTKNQSNIIFTMNANDKKPLSKVLNTNNKKILENNNYIATAIIINNNKILIEKLDSGQENLISVLGRHTDAEALMNLKLQVAIEKKTNKKLKNMRFWLKKKTIDDYFCDFYIVELEDNNLENNNLVWYDFNSIIDKNNLIGKEYILFKECIEKVKMYENIKEANDLLKIINSYELFYQTKNKLKITNYYAYGIVICDDPNKILLEISHDKNAIKFSQNGNKEENNSKAILYDLFEELEEEKSNVKSKLIKHVIEKTKKDIEIIEFFGHTMDSNHNLIMFYVIVLKNSNISSNDLKWYDLRNKSNLIVGPAFISFIDSVSQSNSKFKHFYKN